MNKIFAIVGLCGAGKSEAGAILREYGFGYIRFGQITIDILRKEGKEINEKNERDVREKIRKEHGMGAFALLNLPKIEELLKKGNVVADGLYSWEEYLILKEKFGDNLILISLVATKAIRYKRLEKREIRPLTVKEAISRDHAQIENLHQGGPIAIADYFVKNDGTLEDLKKEINNIVKTVLD